MKIMKKLLVFVLIVVWKIGFCQTSVPLYQNKTVQNTTNANKYASVYKYSYRQANQTIIKYAWIESDLFGGNIVRGKRLGVTYPDYATAEANTPVGYGSITNPNALFETTVLPNYVSGADDPPTNYLNISGFPTTPPTTTNFAVNLIQGSSVEYLGVGGAEIVSKGLATGNGNNRMWSLAEVSNDNRSHWNVHQSNGISTPSQYETFGDNEAVAVSGQRTDRLGAAVYPKWYMADNETFEWENVANHSAFIKGFYNRAKLFNPNFVYYMYGKKLTLQFPTWNPQGNVNYVFPKIDPVLLANHTTPSGLINTEHANKDVIFDCVTYAKALLPNSGFVYEKDGNGNFVIDGNGNRVYRNSGFQNTTREGQVFSYGMPWSGGTDPISGENYAQVVPEWHIAMTQPYVFYARAITALQSLAILAGVPNNDITTIIGTSPYQLGFTVRATSEANTWGHEGLALDKASTQISGLIGMILTKNLWIWDSNNNNSGLSNNGSGIHQAVNQGQLSNLILAGVFGQYNWHNGFFRQMLALQYENRKLNRDYGFRKKTTKILTFTDYREIEAKAELLGFGELEGNSIDLVLMYPLLEVGEQCVVTVGNTQNTQTFQVTLDGMNDVEHRQFTFSGVSNLQANQVWVQYNSVKVNTATNQRYLLKHSGNLVNHNI
jgi:hypothetical protein